MSIKQVLKNFIFNFLGEEPPSGVSTADLLNTTLNGLAEGGGAGGALIVPMGFREYADGYELYQTRITSNEIASAFENGTQVVAKNTKDSNIYHLSSTRHGGITFFTIAEDIHKPGTYYYSVLSQVDGQDQVYKYKTYVLNTGTQADGGK